MSLGAVRDVSRVASLRVVSLPITIDKLAAACCPEELRIATNFNSPSSIICHYANSTCFSFQYLYFDEHHREQFAPLFLMVGEVLTMSSSSFN